MHIPASLVGSKRSASSPNSANRVHRLADDAQGPGTGRPGRRRCVPARRSGSRGRGSAAGGGSCAVGTAGRIVSALGLLHDPEARRCNGRWFTSMACCSVSRAAGGVGFQERRGRRAHAGGHGAHRLAPAAVVTADTAEAEAVKVVTRMHKTLIWERTRAVLAAAACPCGPTFRHAAGVRGPRRP
jgi:hypothetical protein